MLTWAGWDCQGPVSSRWVNICAGQLLLCQTASSAMGENSQKSQSITWEKVLIKWDFINLPIKWDHICSAAGPAAEWVLLTVSLLVSGLVSCEVTLERLQVWFQALSWVLWAVLCLWVPLGAGVSWPGCCLSQHSRTQMDPRCSIGVKLCPPK